MKANDEVSCIIVRSTNKNFKKISKDDIRTFMKQMHFKSFFEIEMNNTPYFFISIDKRVDDK